MVAFVPTSAFSIGYAELYLAVIRSILGLGFQTVLNIKNGGLWHRYFYSAAVIVNGPLYPLMIICPYCHFHNPTE
ncbi:MAG: hypothetical protein AAF282_06285, partial [Cyanobacteria bacterium P01_A01_bin.15]